ncbi:MAG: glycoside hydrolase family 13 protein [Flavobacteriaceae bacterium]|jgi:glycosidase|nr:glycoside hydrolase family 13 protein [Flavobacteriaceae bacterium]
MKKIAILSLMIPLFNLFNACSTQKPSVENEILAFTQPPEWSKNAVWYQIFAERFRNGDNLNDPKPAWMQGAWPHNYPANWKITQWTSDWYKDYDKAKSDKDYYDNNIQTRRYGGDLQGIIDKLDYIQNLGITALYINPLNDSPSSHKYDARNFHHIDITFGNDPEGDLKLMQNENPTHPKTWHFTSADKMFLKLIKEAHKRNIKVVLDYSWNHTGIAFWAWKDILKNKEKSKYADWYEIQSFNTPDSPNGIKYSGWAGVSELPELKKVDVENRTSGHPYKGNIYEPVKQHIFDVTRRWLDPNGDGNFSDGVDGYRLDVADQIGLDFWRDYRKFCRSVNPECYLIGEIWWEQWPDRMMNPMPYLQGDMFDAVMLYQAYKPARDFFAKSVEYGGAEKLKERLNQVFDPMPDYTKQTQMMMSGSHDMERILTDFYNKDKFKFNFKPTDNLNILTGKPDEETYRRVQNYLIFQYTFLGSPQIWAGDEMGMWGTDDPDDRKPLWWDDMTFEPETNNPFHPDSQKEKIAVGFNKSWNDFYKKLIKIRKDNPALSSAHIEWLAAEGDLLVYRRSDGNSSIVFAINNSDSEMQIPENMKLEGEDLLTGNHVELVDLKPMEAVIIKEK